MEKNNNDKNEIFKSLGTVGGLGFTLVFSTFTGLGIGIWVDKLTGLQPLFTISCLIFGVVAGFIYIFVKFTKND